MRRTSKGKLSLSRETLHTVVGGVISTRTCQCPATYSVGVTHCGTCPVVTRDWPSCDATFCTKCFTDVKCEVA